MKEWPVLSVTGVPQSETDFSIRLAKESYGLFSLPQSPDDLVEGEGYEGNGGMCVVYNIPLIWVWRR